jgi:hypothetical protein
VTGRNRCADGIAVIAFGLLSETLGVSQDTQNGRNLYLDNEAAIPGTLVYTLV